LFDGISHLLAHEVWTTLCGDGRKGPFYVRTKDRNVNPNLFASETDAYICLVPPLKSNGKDMTPAERGMLAYLFYNVNVSGFLNRGDVLMFDGEASFQTPVVKEMLKRCGIRGLVIKPPELHQLLSPCDNHFHALFKLAYYRLLANQSVSKLSNDTKLQLALECYRAIDNFSIISMFKKCGLLPTPGQEKRTTLMKLISEGICAVKKSPSHRRNLVCYLKWCEKTGNISLCQSITADILRAAGVNVS